MTAPTPGAPSGPHPVRRSEPSHAIGPGSRREVRQAERTLPIDSPPGTTGHRQLIHAGRVWVCGAAVFMIDMNKVFEEFIEARLVRLLAGRLVVKPQSRSHLDHACKVVIQPDLVFRSKNLETVYVADTKYKVTADRPREGERLLPTPRVHDGARRARGHAHLLSTRRRRPVPHDRSRPRAQATPDHAGSARPINQGRRGRDAPPSRRPVRRRFG